MPGLRALRPPPGDPRREIYPYDENPAARPPDPQTNEDLDEVSDALASLGDPDGANEIAEVHKQWRYVWAERDEPDWPTCPRGTVLENMPLESIIDKQHQIATFQEYGMYERPPNNGYVRLSMLEMLERDGHIQPPPRRSQNIIVGEDGIRYEDEEEEARAAEQGGKSRRNRGQRLHFTPATARAEADGTRSVRDRRRQRAAQPTDSAPDARSGPDDVFTDESMRYTADDELTAPDTDEIEEAPDEENLEPPEESLMEADEEEEEDLDLDLEGDDEEEEGEELLATAEEEEEEEDGTELRARHGDPTDADEEEEAEGEPVGAYRAVDLEEEDDVLPAKSRRVRYEDDDDIIAGGDNEAGDDGDDYLDAFEVDDTDDDPFGLRNDDHGGFG
ncbi:hypothetical protein CDCA_CDCA07G2268 [Cyanidium caldarium]|uniref:Uncharacterized protein n=1 Tax=Cyanidium caldarium TaxID=2771 RepID=A0AAV9IVZ0_CYACA|nr:hypothetical protein CDCA_CDCA07G2268 [Cyanidium caldarium]